MNDNLISILLFIHIIFGGMGLVVGSIVFSKKYKIKKALQYYLQ